MNFTDRMAATSLDFVQTFGASVSYTPAGGNAVTINGIYDQPHQMADAYGQVMTTEPSVTVAASDVPNLKKGDVFLINGITFYVISPETDGQGLTQIKLSRDA